MQQLSFTGPATWGNNFPLCNGDQQSPIALITDDAVIDYSLGQFSRSLFATPSTGMTLINTQHTRKKPNIFFEDFNQNYVGVSILAAEKRKVSFPDLNKCCLKSSNILETKKI